ncbi:hypothetical protein [Capnocytophaga cynodegmi]|uniref:hypothetical protein n=1 Tax=Capnocytophaga cynodegmi TaxID=28189 RepID=UPI001BB32065|nr:hypothetical protein [Capnocytophaga cynodegmi]
MNTILKLDDYYHQAMDYILENLNDIAYKKLKNGTLKKKSGDLTFEIITQKDRNNFLSHQEKVGSLSILHFSANIYDKKKNLLYQFSFGEPKSYVPRFELFKNYSELDYSLLDRIIADLNQHFIPATQKLQENPQMFLQNTDYQSEIVAEDYHYRIWILPELYENFATVEQLKLYEENKSVFQMLENKLKRDVEEYLYLVSKQNRDYFLLENANKYSQEQLLQILSIAHKIAENHKNKERNAIRYEYIKNRPYMHEELFILVFYFLKMTNLEEKITKQIYDEMKINFIYQ